MSFSRKLFYSIVFAIVLLVGGAYLFARQHVNIAVNAVAADDKTLLGFLQAPTGYQVSFFAPPMLGLKSPRQLAVGENDWVFAGSRSGNVYALRDDDNDGTADTSRLVAQGFNIPHGVAYADNVLYIGALENVYMINNINEALANNSFANTSLQVFIDGLPDSAHHGTRHIKIGKDNMLYLSLGTPCNICLPPDENFTNVIRRYALPASSENTNDDNKNDKGEVFASGIRNSVGFDFHPRNGELWFTDNGRDWLGDELPSDELNRAHRQGLHFGFPYCHQGDFADPEFGEDKNCADYEAPALNTGAHVANLGMSFAPDGDYIYIALHGSWNRSEKTGYTVHRAALNETGDSITDYSAFVEGWLRNDGSVAGRPVDIVFLENGDMLISDDFAHVIYRVSKLS